MYQDLVKKVGDNHLTDSVKITLAAALPFFIFVNTDGYSIPFAFSMGVLLTSATDVVGSFGHKFKGLLLGSVLIALVTFLLCSMVPYRWIFYPFFALLLFSASIIAVYGYRASLLSFSILLTISLAFVYDYTGWELFYYCAYLLGGGLLYTLISLLFYLVKPKRYVNLELANCIDKTGDYLDIRTKLWSEDADTEELTKQQLDLQIQLNELHENIRNFLVHNKSHIKDTSNNRKLLIALSSLVEMMELSSTNVFNHAQIREMYADEPGLITEYQNMARHMALTLHELSYHIKANKRYHSPVNLIGDFKSLKNRFEEYVAKNNLTPTSNKYIVFSNVLHYAEKQIQKVKGLERVYKQRVNADQLRGKYKDLEKFLSPQHYRVESIKENLNFNSSIFRHSLRLTITIIAGYALGEILLLQKEYWILMTIIVIMRPGYGLTKQRSKDRVLGTILGCLIAFGVLYFIQNDTIIILLTLVSMILGYWMAYSKYSLGVTFITLCVALLYGFITPNVEDMVVYRITDTVIGAILAFAATHLLWPSWEFLKIRYHLKETLTANKNFVTEIKTYYNVKGEPTTAYKIARKYAYTEVGNLMSSFQRMVQEPKSKQKYRAELYEMVVLNQALLSANASIGTYIQSHTTTKASNAFNIVMDQIVDNLNKTSELLEENPRENIKIEITKDFETGFSTLKKIKREELESTVDDPEKRIQLLEESQLVIDQLVWMISLSEKLFNTAQKIEEKRKELRETKKRKKAIFG